MSYQVSIFHISSSFLFNTVRFSIFNTVKNSNTTEGGYTQSQDMGSYRNIRRAVSMSSTRRVFECQ